MRIQILILGFKGLKRPVSAPKCQFTLTGDKLFTQELSVSETKWSSLLARTGALILYISI